MNTMQNHKIIGTAGHIDHGKTTLIKALTDIDTDRLKEEKKRGITIDLGFSYLTLDNKETVGIIDVPGHESFIKNMMSGAVGMDLVMLVIAADDGIMPQTIEHIKILTHLGIKNGIVVLTKVDTVDNDWKELVKEDILYQLEETFLKDSPVIEVDSISKKGIEDLKCKIESLLSKSSEENQQNLAKMHIDRVFDIKGHGTIITGTMAEGSIEVGDQLVIYPGEHNADVKNIEIHGSEQNQAYKGQRVAVNIPNLNKIDVNRGDILTSKNNLVKSSIIDCSFSLDKGNSIELKHWDRVRVFIGTREVLARVVPLSTDVITSGTKEIVQFRLEEPVFLNNNENFVVRSFSPITTIGGGYVLNALGTKANHNNSDYVKNLEYILKHGVKGAIYNYINYNKISSIEEIQALTGLGFDEISEHIKILIKNEYLVELSGRYITKDKVDKYYKTIIQTLSNYHKTNSLEDGMSIEELRSRVSNKLTVSEFRELLCRNKEIRVDKSTVSLRTFRVELTEREEVVINEIMKEIVSAEPSLLYEEDIGDIEKLNYLIRTNEIVIFDNQIIRIEYLNKIEKNVLDYIEKNEDISVVEFRDMLGVGRKLAISILEYLDSQKVTRRIDNIRVKY